ncbi:MAG: heavy-metal-associated domain-containing protein [Gammaproteobacteria bacterium]
MFTLNVPDMTCGHCASVVTAAVKDVDHGAALDFDIPGRTVKVQTSAEVAAILAALDAAGYPSTARAPE